MAQLTECSSSEDDSARCDYSTIKKVNQYHYRPELPRGFQEVKVPRLRDNGLGW